MDDNPGERSNRINGAYPKGRALSTVPPNVLAVLPHLPEDVRYAFLGRHLILLDTRANVILDRIPLALHRPGVEQGAAGGSIDFRKQAGAFPALSLESQRPLTVW